MTQYTRFYPHNSGQTLEQIAAALNEAAESELAGDLWDYHDIKPGEIPLSFAQAFVDGQYTVSMDDYRGEDERLDSEYQFEYDALAVFLMFSDHPCEYIGPVTHRHRVVVTVEVETEIDIGADLDENLIEHTLNTELPFRVVRDMIARGECEHAGTSVYSAFEPSSVIYEI